MLVVHHMAHSRKELDRNRIDGSNALSHFLSRAGRSLKTCGDGSWPGAAKPPPSSVAREAARRLFLSGPRCKAVPSPVRLLQLPPPAGVGSSGEAQRVAWEGILECCSQHEGEAGKRSCFHQLMFGPRVSGRAWLRVDSEPCAACSQPDCKESSPALDCRGDSALCPGSSVSALLTCGVAHSLLWGVLGTVGCLAATRPHPPPPSPPPPPPPPANCDNQKCLHTPPRGSRSPQREPLG